jgi:hypothetical protein
MVATMKGAPSCISEEDKRMDCLVRAISEKGRHVEVKLDRDGHWVVYEVSKKKKMAG